MQYILIYKKTLPYFITPHHVWLWQGRNQVFDIITSERLFVMLSSITGNLNRQHLPRHHPVCPLSADWPVDRGIFPGSRDVAAQSHFWWLGPRQKMIPHLTCLLARPRRYIRRRISRYAPADVTPRTGQKTCKMWNYFLPRPLWGHSRCPVDVDDLPAFDVFARFITGDPHQFAGYRPDLVDLPFDLGQIDL